MTGLSAVAFRLHVTGLCFVARQLTDGAISSGSLRGILANSGAAKRHVTELVTAGLWEVAGDGHRVHDYLDWNSSRSEVEARVEQARKAARARWNGNG